MKSIKSYFGVQLNEKNISHAMLHSFASDHIARLRTNNVDHKYDDIITDTENLINSFYENWVAEDRNRAVQEGSTVEVYDLRLETKEYISRYEGIIRATFGTESAEYQEFFPYGVSEYHTAPLDKLITLLNRFIIAVEAHQDQLPSTLKTTLNDLCVKYTEARKEQLRNKGAVSGSKSQRNNARKELCARLTCNMLAIAMNNIGNTRAADVYFNQSLVSRHKHSKNRKEEVGEGVGSE